MNSCSLHGKPKAQAFIVDILAARQPGDQTRLPGIRALAVQCGVAPRTMWGAVHRLAGARVLTVIPGGGVLPGPSQVSKETVRTVEPVDLSGIGQPRCHSLRNRIAQDIRANIFAAGRLLPTGKELAARYGTCHATLRKALTLLVNDRILESCRRGYHVRQTAAPSRQSTLVLIGDTDSALHLARATQRAREFWRVLEQECKRLNLALDVQPTAGFTGKNRRNGRSPEQVSGYVVWAINTAEDLLGRILALLSGTGRPVSVLDESTHGYGRDVLRLGISPSFRAFALGFDRLPGQIAGEHLLHLGHRRAVCFQLAAETGWCCNRTDGVRGAFNAAGHAADAVTVMIPTGMQRFEQINDAMNRWPPIAALRKNKNMENEAVSLWHQWDAGALFTEQGQPRLWCQYLQQLLEPLFSAALADSSLTAWVTANDVVGLLALDYLRRKGVRVPQDVSVVGFDDSNEAFVAGLSSYNFNVPALVMAMLEHILPLDRRRKRDLSRAHVQIAGQVMPRGSSGRASG